MRLPTSWRNARVTLAIALVTAAAWLLVEASGLQARAISWGAFSPYRFSFDGYAPGAPVWITPLTATLLHDGLVHIGFNMLMLVICGRPTEAVLGPFSLALLYLLGAFAAAGGHYLQDPNSTVPMIGASGAVSAVLGAYAILFGRNKVPIRNATLALIVNALWLIAAWIALNVVIGIVTRSGPIHIAVGAHIGGFLVGIALARPLLLFRYRRA